MAVVKALCLFALMAWPVVRNPVSGYYVDFKATKPDGQEQVQRVNTTVNWKVTVPRLCGSWLEDKKEYDLNKDGIIDFKDFAVYAKKASSYN